MVNIVESIRNYGKTCKPLETVSKPSGNSGEQFGIPVGNHAKNVLNRWEIVLGPLKIVGNRGKLLNR